MEKVNFNTLYNEIYSKHSKLLEAKRTGALVKQSIIVIIFVALFFVVLSIAKQQGILLIMLLPLLFILMRFFMVLVSRKYRNDFKENAIKILVEGCGESYQYSRKKGIEEYIYRKSGFDNFWDYYSSEDLVEGNFSEHSNFKMSQVKTERIVEERDSNGHVRRRREVTFLGIFGIIKLPVFITTPIKINSNSRFHKYNKNRVEMDSAEFERNFDVFSEDRLGVMEVLTR